MQYYLIYLTAAVGLIVPHLIEPIFVQFFEYMGSYLGNGFTNVGLQMHMLLAGIRTLSKHLKKTKTNKQKCILLTKRNITLI